MKLDIKTEDNIVLKAEIKEAKNPKAFVLINPGTATPTSFYNNFATFLIENNFHVMQWNYRGFSDSKLKPLSECDYRYTDIGFYDLPAIIKKVKELYPDLPLLVVGHSAGGQQIGFASNRDQVDGLVSVAVSGGHFSFMPLGYRIQALLFFRLIVPIFGRIYGYVPASKFGIMEDLTLNLAKEWDDWCRDPDYFFSQKFFGKSVPATTFQNTPFPIVVMTADDDEISTKENVQRFWSHVSSKKGLKFINYKAKDFPTKKIGHFGYFRKTNQKIWKDIVLELNNMLTHSKEA